MPRSRFSATGSTPAHALMRPQVKPPRPPPPHFWAFRPPTRPRIPSVRNTIQATNPIDSFLLARLEANGSEPSRPKRPGSSWCAGFISTSGACRRRPNRSTPSSPTVAPTPGERLIDRLLASPHYGERWGRHWLDLAGYADSEGILDADYERSAAWRYRDYVIRAFNADTPYDRFLRARSPATSWSITGPSIAPRKPSPREVVEALVATGYLRCASDTSRPDFVKIKNAPGYYYQTLEDTVKIVASSTMGLTLQCAKCHTHKYDPITQEEYYRVQAVFMSGYRPAQWVPQVERKLQ